jgi:hypothetical protein
MPGNLRGPEGPLFHGDARIREFSATSLVVPGHTHSAVLAAGMPPNRIGWILLHVAMQFELHLFESANGRIWLVALGDLS